MVRCNGEDSGSASVVGVDAQADAQVGSALLMPSKRRLSLPLNLTSMPDPFMLTHQQAAAAATAAAAQTGAGSAAGGFSDRPPQHPALTAKSTAGRTTRSTGRPMDAQTLAQLEAMVDQMPLMARIMSRAKLAERLDADTAAALSGVGSLTSRSHVLSRQPGSLTSVVPLTHAIPANTQNGSARMDDVEPPPAVVTARLRNALSDTIGLEADDEDTATRGESASPRAPVMEVQRRSAASDLTQAFPLSSQQPPQLSVAHVPMLSAYDIAGLAAEVVQLRDAVASTARQLASVSQQLQHVTAALQASERVLLVKHKNALAPAPQPSPRLSWLVCNCLRFRAPTSPPG